MAKIVKNERSWAIDLISMLNIFLQNKTLNIKKVGGEATINTGKKTMFPDLLMYGDESQTQILQGCEIKLPDTLITDEEFIKDAQRKSDTLGLNSCLLWNFTSAAFYVKDESGIYNIEKQWNDTSFIKTREDVEQYKKDWQSLIESIILEINNYFLSGELKASRLGEVISDSVMDTIISRNKVLVANYLETESVKNRTLASHLSIWWNEVKNEYLSDEPNKFTAFSKHILLNWINKFSFAHAIKKYHSPAFQVESINYSTNPQTGSLIFDEISSKCDFYNIFKKIDYGNYLPRDTWHDLVEYNLFLSENGVANFDQRSLQQVLEQSVRNAKREIIGQFTTPPVLADFLARITVEDLTWNTLDPCCGTGTIPKAILDLKKTGIAIENAHVSTWASDKFSFPLQITNLNLTDIESINIPSRIFQSNVFDLELGRDISIVDPKNGNILNLSLPQYDAILSNLPFVAFEVISDDEKVHLLNTIRKLEEKWDMSLGARSDLYTYIVIKLWSLLKEGGTLGIITSNAWLGTESGKQFYQVMRKLYKIEKVIISGEKRWFLNANVVTTIIILKKKENLKEISEYATTFIKLNVPIHRLENLETMSHVTDSILTSAAIDERFAKTINYNQETIDNILNCKVSMNTLFHDVNWLLDLKNKMIKITDLFKINRGERRGWDKLFYPNEAHSIEPLYIKKVLKSSKTLTYLKADPDADAFCCSPSLEELQNNNHQGAMNWIKKFENEVNGKGKPLPEVLRKPNLQWYEMSDNATADLITSLNPDKRLFYAKFAESTFINQRLIGLKARGEHVDIDIAHILLNSIVGMFYLEATGFGRGLGALDISKNNLEQTFMLNPNLLSDFQKQEIKTAFEPILEREILTTFEEFENEDRINFEKIVLRAYELEDYYERIKNSLLSMQKTRLTAKEK